MKKRTRIVDVPVSQTLFLGQGDSLARERDTQRDTGGTAGLKPTSFNALQWDSGGGHL